MSQPPALSARFGDRFHRLPDGAETLASKPLIRPLPGATPPLLGLVAARGLLLPALVPMPDGPFDRADLDWVFLPAPLSLVVGVREVRPAAPDDELLPEVLLATAPAAQTAPVAAHGSGMPAPAPTRHQADISAHAYDGVLRLTFAGGPHADLPTARIVRVVAAQPMAPVPGRSDGALGYVNTPAGDAIVLDPVWLLGAPARDSYPLLVLFEMSGRRLALPCDRVAPAPRGTPAVMPGPLAGPEPLPAMLMAPDIVPDPPEPPRPTRQLVVAEAGGVRFALPADAVAAILPPREIIPAPPGSPAGVIGMCAHHGDVLPVMDTAGRLGAAASSTGGPLVRLMLSPPVALCIDSVPSLHRLPASTFTPVGGYDGLLDSVTRLDGRPLLVCRPHALAASRHAGRAA